jgi:inner membrane protein
LQVATIKDDFAVVEQRDANTFLIHSLSIPDELYQVSNRPDMGHQIVSERITGKVGRKIVTSIESVSWVDEEVLLKLDKMLDRYPDAQMYLTGSIEIDDPEQISIQAKPQQLATAIKQGRKLEFNSCPLTVALNLLREQWGSGQVRIRVIVNSGQ